MARDRSRPGRQRTGCRRYLTLLRAVRAMLDAIITAVIRVFERFGRVSGARWPPRSRDGGTGRA
jgi:hypothetical protein